MTAFKQTITPAIVDLIVDAGEQMHDTILVEQIGIDYGSYYCPICGVENDEDGWDDCGCHYDLIFHD